jgi:hypothetical protein
MFEYHDLVGKVARRAESADPLSVLHTHTRSFSPTCRVQSLGRHLYYGESASFATNGYAQLQGNG